MNFAVLGTGMVGRAVAARLDELGHDVTIGTRDPAGDPGRTDADGMGNPPSPPGPPTTRASPGHIRRGRAAADVVVNATNGSASLDVLALAGAENLADKILIDIANPLDFSRGMPPTLLVKDTDSLGEQIQRAFPDSRVVKTLNTLNADLMVRPDGLPDESSIFVSGNDADAKTVTTSSWSPSGTPTSSTWATSPTARGTEMLLPVWLRLMGRPGTPAFNFKIVR